MAKKDKSFAAKVARASKKTGAETCPVCGEQVTHSRVIFSTRTEKGDWRPRSLLTPICKCNQDAVFGGEA